MTPHALFDFLKRESEIKSDSALARALKVKPPVISKMRTGRLKVGVELILRIHLQTDMPVRDILRLLKQTQEIKSIYEEELAA